MAYSLANPPREVSQGPITGSAGGRLWHYNSADAAATVAGANYFSNALNLGMKAGDFIFVYDSATPLMTGWLVHSVAAAGATLGASGITIGN